MYNRKSAYALNKQDPDAIVCPGVTGAHRRLTRADFKTEEEFLFWKQWSDENYHEEDNADVVEEKHTLSFFEISDHALAVPGLEKTYMYRMEWMERGKTSAELVLQIRNYLTDRQFRRLWLYCVDGMTQAKIAQLEGVGQQRVSVSISAAKKRIKKIIK